MMQPKTFLGYIGSSNIRRYEQMTGMFNYWHLTFSRQNEGFYLTVRTDHLYLLPGGEECLEAYNDELVSAQHGCTTILVDHGDANGLSVEPLPAKQHTHPCRKVPVSLSSPKRPMASSVGTAGVAAAMGDKVMSDSE